MKKLKTYSNNFMYRKFLNNTITSHFYTKCCFNPTFKMWYANELLKSSRCTHFATFFVSFFQVKFYLLRNVFGGDKFRLNADIELKRMDILSDILMV